MQEIIEACKALEKAQVFDIIALPTDETDKEVEVSLTEASLVDIRNALEDKTLSNEEAIAKVIYNRCGVYPEVEFKEEDIVHRLHMFVSYFVFTVTKKAC